MSDVSLLGSIIVVVFLLGLTQAAEPDQAGAVIPVEKIRSIHADNYEEIIGAAGGDWLVRFFSPSCGVCKDTHKTWEEAVDQVGDDSMKFGAVDCLEDPELCRIFDIKWYPTIKRISNNQVYEYSGAPSKAENIVEFAKTGWVRANPVLRPKVGDKVQSRSSTVMFILVASGCILALGYTMLRLSSSPRKKKGGLLD